MFKICYQEFSTLAEWTFLTCFFTPKKTIEKIKKNPFKPLGSNLLSKNFLL